MIVEDALSMEACGIVMMSACNPDGNCMELAQNKVLSPVKCALLTVSALLHPCVVHLGSSCLPLHCDGWKRGQVQLVCTKYRCAEAKNPKNGKDQERVLKVVL